MSALEEVRRRGVRLIVSIILSLVTLALFSVLSGLLTGSSENQHLTSLSKHQTPELPGVRLNAHEMSLLGCLSEPSKEKGAPRLDSVGGLDGLKEDLRTSVVLPLRARKSFFGGPACLEPSRGLLLVGAPGTGKTMLARALAMESGSRLITIHPSALENKYVGESGKLVSAAFSLARKAQPCVLFFDEIDGLMRERSTEDGSPSYGLKTDLLVQLDRWEEAQSDAVVVVGSTNNARSLDPALKRRLPKVCAVGVPTPSGREQILKSLMQREPPHARTPAPEVKELLLVRTEGSTGSDLRSIYRAAANQRLRRQLREVKGFEEALHEARDIEGLIQPISLSDWSNALDEFDRGRREAQVDHCSSSRSSPGREGLSDLLQKLVREPDVKKEASKQ